VGRETIAMTYTTRTVTFMVGSEELDEDFMLGLLLSIGDAIGRYSDRKKIEIDYVGGEGRVSSKRQGYRYIAAHGRVKGHTANAIQARQRRAIVDKAPMDAIHPDRDSQTMGCWVRVGDIVDADLRKRIETAYDDILREEGILG